MNEGSFKMPTNEFHRLVIEINFEHSLMEAQKKEVMEKMQKALDFCPKKNMSWVKVFRVMREKNGAK